jgi:hypothetical protein
LFHRANKVAIREAGGIPVLVALLERGGSPSSFFALGVLRQLATSDAENKVAILESGAVPLLVAIVESGSLESQEQAAAALAVLADDHEACCLAIRDAGGIPQLVALAKHKLKHNLRDHPFPDTHPGVGSRLRAVQVLHSLSANSATDMVAIALAYGGVDAIIELAREGLVVLSAQEAIGSIAAPGSKRKAALVVAALLRDCVPGFKLAPRDIKMAIGSFF